MRASGTPLLGIHRRPSKIGQRRRKGRGRPSLLKPVALGPHTLSQDCPTFNAFWPTHASPSASQASAVASRTRVLVSLGQPFPRGILVSTSIGHRSTYDDQNG